jgi:Flp pilus assembly protein CpaB
MISARSTRAAARRLGLRLGLAGACGLAALAIGDSWPQASRAAPAAAPARVAPAAPLVVDTGLAAGIRPGGRAATIAVGPAAGLAGFVAPGDRVDVLLTQTLNGRRTAQTLLEDLVVLGGDQRRRDSGPAAALSAASDVVAAATSAGGAAPPALMTLEVTLRAAQALAVARELGRLLLVLRGPGGGASDTGGRRWAGDVTGLPAAAFPMAGCG